MESPQGQDTPGPSVPGRSRLIAGGGIAALAVLLLGGALERVLIGTDPDATARAVREINTHVARVDGALTRVARELAGRVEVQDGLTGDRPAVRTVFDLLRATDGDQPFSDLAITLYDARLVPRAWHGRPAELSPERLQSGATGFADVGPAGLRLVHVEPIVESTLEPGARARRLGLPMPHNFSLDFMKPLRYGGEHGDSESGRAQPAGQPHPTASGSGRVGIAGHSRPRAGCRSRL